MVNANARIYLDWAHLRDGGAVGRLQAQGIVYIDYLDRAGRQHGTQMGNRHNLALIQTHWGRAVPEPGPPGDGRQLEAGGPGQQCGQLLVGDGAGRSQRAVLPTAAHRGPGGWPVYCGRP